MTADCDEDRMSGALRPVLAAAVRAAVAEQRETAAAAYAVGYECGYLAGYAAAEMDGGGPPRTPPPRVQGATF